LDAYIQFPEGVTVTYDGMDIATIALPPICAFADSGVPELRSDATLTITDQAGYDSRLV
jgi:hypothetical protein